MTKGSLVLPRVGVQEVGENAGKLADTPNGYAIRVLSMSAAQLSLTVVQGWEGETQPES